MKVSLPAGEHHHFFDQLHQLEWNQMISQSDFSFTKIKEDFLNMALVQSFDVLFYDAFGYHAQPEMWHGQLKEHLPLGPAAHDEIFLWVVRLEVACLCRKRGLAFGANWVPKLEN